MVLTLVICPAAAVVIGPVGPGVIVVLGLSFAVMRVVYWVGCHWGQRLQAFGGAASAMPTGVVAIWSLVGLVI